MPRSTRLTPALQETICGFVNAGAPLPKACEAAGVSWNTVKDWLARGREGRQPYADFVAAFQKAKATWEVGSATSINEHGKKDWKALSWLLERRNPAMWAPPKNQREHTIQVNDQLRLVFERLRAVLPERFTFPELMEALAKEGEDA